MVLRNLESSDQFNEIDQVSGQGGAVIFKHSTRCVISSMAWNRLQRDWNEQVEALPVYYLDLIKFRSTSSAVAQYYGVDHESPQLLYVKDGKVEYQTSHNGINVSDLKELFDA
jgi:bacillithiol system protein YtxJ